MRRLLQLARWFETFWWCRCNYSNIAALRCYACGARPPKRLRAEIASTPLPEGTTVRYDTVDA
jgi:hypothetical protein